MFRKTFLVLISIFVSLGGVATAQADGITMQSSAPYQSEDDIPLKIIDECTTLGSKLSKFTQSYAKKKGIEINLSDSVDHSSGKTLVVEITNAVSEGNAFIGHRKFVAVEGSLFENGSKIASFKGQRSSGGGAFAGYKGSCAVLGRCVKTLGKDIAAWLVNPKDSRRIGE